MYFLCFRFDFFSQSTLALKELKDNDMIHTDIKQDNILIRCCTGRADMVPVLIDYGSAHIFTMTPKYTIEPDEVKDVLADFPGMPPEYTSGYLHPKSDLYSLGAVMRTYANSTGHRGIEKLVDKCQKLDPDKRPDHDKLSEKLLKLDKRGRKPSLWYRLRSAFVCFVASESD